MERLDARRPTSSPASAGSTSCSLRPRFFHTHLGARGDLDRLGLDERVVERLATSTTTPFGLDRSVTVVGAGVARRRSAEPADVGRRPVGASRRRRRGRQRRDRSGLTGTLSTDIATAPSRSAAAGDANAPAERTRHQALGHQLRRRTRRAASSSRTCRRSSWAPRRSTPHPSGSCHLATLPSR